MRSRPTSHSSIAAPVRRLHRPRRRSRRRTRSIPTRRHCPHRTRSARPDPSPARARERPSPHAAGRLLWPVPGGSISQYFHWPSRARHRRTLRVAGGGRPVGRRDVGGWRNNGGGNVIAIDHGGGLQTVYNHLGPIWVSAGAYVAAGQGIGVGCTGICTGPHVHFEVIANGVIDNPQRYFWANAPLPRARRPYPRTRVCRSPRIHVTAGAGGTAPRLPARGARAAWRARRRRRRSRWQRHPPRRAGHGDTG